MDINKRILSNENNEPVFPITGSKEVVRLSSIKSENLFLNAKGGEIPTSDKSSFGNIEDSLSGIETTIINESVVYDYQGTGPEQQYLNDTQVEGYKVTLTNFSENKNLFPKTKADIVDRIGKNETIETSFNTIDTTLTSHQALLDDALYSTDREALNDMIGDLAGASGVSSVNGKSGIVTLEYNDVHAAATTHSHTVSDVSDFPQWVLSYTSKPTYTAAEIGARDSSWTPSATDIDAVPTSRKVNNKALSSDITLTASDVGAVAKTGDTMTGDLSVSNGTISSTVSIHNDYAAFKNVSSGGVGELLVGKNTNSAGWELVYGKSDGGDFSYYNVYHTGYKPALADCTGTLSVAKGGTGATTAAAARTNLGLGTIATKASTDYLINRPPYIEFQASSTTCNNGGFLDFHYNQSTADYTSRIIEPASGTLNINGVSAISGGNLAVPGTLFVPGVIEIQSKTNNNRFIGIKDMTPINGVEGNTWLGYLRAWANADVSTTGTCDLMLGNSINVGTARNAKGQIRLFGQNTGGVNISYTNTTTNASVVFSGYSGQVVIGQNATANSVTYLATQTTDIAVGDSLPFGKVVFIYE